MFGGHAWGPLTRSQWMGHSHQFLRQFPICTRGKVHSLRYGAGCIFPNACTQVIITQIKTRLLHPGRFPDSLILAHNLCLFIYYLKLNFYCCIIITYNSGIHCDVSQSLFNWKCFPIYPRGSQSLEKAGPGRSSPISRHSPRANPSSHRPLL